MIDGKLYELVGVDKSTLGAGEGCVGCAFNDLITGHWCGEIIDATCCDAETETQEFIWKLKPTDDGKTN